MRRLILAVILAMLLPVWGWGADTTVYVSPSGSNTSPYETWTKAANLPSTALTYLNSQAVGIGHTMYIAPPSGASYDDYLSITDADCDNLTIQGTAAHGSTAPAAWGQVVISKTNQHVIRCQRTGVKVKYLKIGGVTSGSNDCMYIDGANFEGTNLWVYDASRYLIYCGLAATFNNLKLSGNSHATNTGAIFYGDTTINYIMVTPSTGSIINGNAVTSASTGNVTINGGFIGGQRNSCLYGSGTGTLTGNNLILIAGDKPSYCAHRASGTVNINNSHLTANFNSPGSYFNGVVGDSNNIKTGNPKVHRLARSGYIIPSVDDLGNYAYAASVAEKLATHNFKGTWSIDTYALATYLSQAQAALSNGKLEAALHSRTHSDLSKTGNVYSITKVGATINVDRAADTITINPGGTVTGFKAKSLATIQTELEALGCTVGAKQANISAQVLGECMADSGGAQASPYTPQFLIDTTGATGFFKAEITDPKAALEAALSRTVYTFSAPYGESSDNLQTTAQALGFYSSRLVNSEADAERDLTNIDLQELVYITGSSLIGVDDATTRSNIRDLCSIVAEKGLIICFLAHNTGEVSLANWDLILTTFKEFPEITITSLYEATNAIKNGGTWSTADSRTYTRTWPSLAQYYIRIDSACLKAGVDVGLSTDFYGRSVHNPPNIGLDDTQVWGGGITPGLGLSPGHRMPPRRR